jgi:hypothetical protein
MLEFNNVLIAQRFMYFDFSYELSEIMVTFCLALERFNEFLAMILAADTFFVYKFVIS